MVLDPKLDEAIPRKVTKRGDLPIQFCMIQHGDQFDGVSSATR